MDQDDPAPSSEDPDNNQNRTNKKRLLLVNTGSSKKKFIIERLSQLDVFLIILNKEKNWADAHADEWILADTDNHEEALNEVRKYSKINHIDGVITFWEDDVILTSKIVDLLNLKGIPHKQVKNIRNKYNFRQFCLKNNLPTPKHKIIHQEKDLHEVISTFTFPVVFKPAFGCSSAFVIKVFNAQELEKIYHFLQSQITVETESALNNGLDIFIEEFLDGEEVDIDFLIQNGEIKFLSLADNYDKNYGYYFIDSGQGIPSVLPQTTQKNLIEMAKITLRKLDIKTGCIHFEAKNTNRGPMPLEINLRMGGDYVHSYTKAAWDIDLVENAAKIALDIDIDNFSSHQPKRCAIGWDLYPAKSGKLTSLTIKTEFHEHIHDYYLNKKIGEHVLVPPEGYDYLGWLVVTGTDVNAARKKLKNALQNFYFQTGDIEIKNTSSIKKLLWPLAVEQAIKI